MSSLKDRRWRRKGIGNKVKSPSLGDLTFAKKLYHLRRMIIAVFASGLTSFAMLYQLETYGYWEAKGAKVDGAVGYGIAYLFLAIFMFLVVVTIKDWRRD